ncbi:uncharacterized protein LOC106150801 [Lingula anatina]|uniref:Uncharacterized protein LOC106150801 n=1 Tax=Lingula anatina TaxID=7574 RepID=A0A1S3H194_LINAN|nr:uncharacterized protein LOC106150801 [Lingula anatina]XP_013379250.1 uncharacterized protein LOC106150801 [Lingula anatina]XP_013379251.1 uncharacterized protein LOC106150801 [Lingula anatina]XP_013379252.1 uncharacterized protein LOC106150801 [Lingula anatina]|eukprot:XP_013379249.1 uncharacterized protein LOC106150801 [Lingula anatina]
MNNLLLTGNRRHLHQFNLKVALVVVIIFVLLTIISYVNELAKAGLLEKRSQRKRVMQTYSNIRDESAVGALANASKDIDDSKYQIHDRDYNKNPKSKKRKHGANVEESEKNEDEINGDGGNHRAKRDAPLEDGFREHLQGDGNHLQEFNKHMELREARKFVVLERLEKHLNSKHAVKSKTTLKPEKYGFQKEPGGSRSASEVDQYSTAEDQEKYASEKGIPFTSPETSINNQSNHHLDANITDISSRSALNISVVMGLNQTNRDDFEEAEMRENKIQEESDISTILYNNTNIVEQREEDTFSEKLGNFSRNQNYQNNLGRRDFRNHNLRSSQNVSDDLLNQTEILEPKKTPGSRMKYMYKVNPAEFEGNITSFSSSRNPLLLFQKFIPRASKNEKSPVKQIQTKEVYIL